ncbi:hypothetical protein [Edaphosphingomonas haloaromaticamans]|uniref:Uncharacterized protein n=1 Tax=Edaphosphingomonas haloaromaticamans TaxID=653954 RepID=A0A1S1HF28_9SPHN|nr:hypothetical protein [Sphingomonas haloaromaticamans]OHT19110.1 hypothetical protein BHE75_01093 [Sphingomonas haloaromaticamans]
MTDFKVIDVPAMLSVPVSSYDANGNQIPDDGEWHRHVSTSLYVFAELLVAKGLTPGKSTVSRTPDLVIKWSELNETGQAFVKKAFDKWLKSIDDVRTTEAMMIQKLEKRWQKFVQQVPLP